MLTGARVPSNDMGRARRLAMTTSACDVRHQPGWKLVRWIAIAIAGLAVCASAPLAGGGGYRAAASKVTAAQLRYSYRPGCPVPPSRLRLLTLDYWGFDGRPHRGSLVVNAAVVTPVEHAFALLFADRFPIRRMEPVDAFKGSDDRSMAADNTSAFNCRYAVATGPTAWSVHAFGEAIDVNPHENPYVLGSQVLPPGGRAYLARSDVRPGMAVQGGKLVSAFATIGWQWGGRWTGAPDYQHFSATGG
jgi:D-alanyl-D-alanine carboxypeptidase